MNKLLVTFIFLTFSPLAMAQTDGLRIDVTCPQINDRGPLTNFGSYIGGYGSESVQGSYPAGIYFKSEDKLPQNIPTDVSKYYNQSVEYDTESGEVTCNYLNADQKSAPIRVSFTLTNGVSALYMKANSSSLTLVFPTTEVSSEDLP